ncbi:MAG: oligosaccharide flippase family protein [Pseudomonadota bacterium]|nr:oligosaccharide flippase family protein [Pseudomonadota bacterium]
MKLFKNYAVLAGGQIAGRLLGFLAFAWLARILNPEAYGAVEYVIGLSVLIATLIDGGPNTVAVRHSAQDPGELPRLAHQILMLRLMLTAVGIPVVALVALSTMKSAVPAGLIALFALSLLPAPWRQEWLFQATNHMSSVASAQVIRAGVFAAMVWALVRAPRDLIAVGWAEIAAVTALTAYCVYIQHTRITPLRLSGSMRGFSKLVQESIAAGSSNIVWAMSWYAPLFMIGILIGGVQTAWFAAAARVVGSLLIFSYVYHYGLYPAVARATVSEDGELADLLAGSGRVAAWGGIFAALALTLLAEPLMVIAMGPKLAPAAPMLQVLAWVLPVSLCTGHAYWTLAAAGAQTWRAGAQLAALGAVVGIGLLFGPFAEGLGFSFAALAGAVTLWAVAHVFAARRGLHPPPFSLVLKPALLAAAIFLAAQVLKAGPWLSLAGLALYAVAAPLLDRRLLRDLSNLGRITLGSDVALRG